MIHATGKVAHTVAEAMKNQPITLAVVVINLLCMVIVGFTLYSVAARATERDKLLSEVIQKCK